MNYDYKPGEGEDAFFEGIELLRSLKLVDSELLLNEYLKDGKKILAEGAQAQRRPFRAVGQDAKVPHGSLRVGSMPWGQVRSPVAVARRSCPQLVATA